MMANEQQGEVEIDLAGRERTIRFTARAVASIETDMGMPIGQAIQMLEHGSVKLLVSILKRAVFPPLSEAQAYEVLDDGAMTDLGEPIGLALLRCKLFSPGGDENPPKATDKAA